MGKKAQSISINTIIIAIIALAVLVVLFVIFTGRIGIFSKGLEETTQRKCTDVNGGSWKETCPDSELPIYSTADAKDNLGRTCCVPKRYP